MGLKTYLLTMSVATVFCWVAWVLAFLTVDPQTTNQIGFGLFYSSLSLALIGTGALIGFVIRFVFLRHDLVLRQVLDAFRQSFLFSLLLIVSLILLSHKLFSWVNLFFLMAGLTMLEYFLVSYRRSH